MSDVNQIYQSSSERYNALVAREDFESNLLPAILEIDPLRGKDVIELGAGTARVSCLIAPLVRLLIATDKSFHMLSSGKTRLKAMGLDNWHMSLESHHALPFAEGSVDVIIAGWSFCYAAIDAGDAWQASLDQALSEVARILRPGCKVILIESLGTGFNTPHPPAVLVDYLDGLEAHGFNSAWIRTDFCFRDKAEAQDLTTFFFGDAPMPMWETKVGVVVPECTGLWWKTY